MRKIKKWMALLLAISMVSSSFTGFGMKVEAAETIDANVTVEARYSSNRIYWEAVAGATGYHVYARLATEENFTKLTTNTTSNTWYVHEAAGTGNEYYYKVEAVNAQGSMGETAAVRDEVFPAPGIDAMQGHAQLHIDLDETEEGRVFENNRVYSILDDTENDDDDIDRIKNLAEGSIFISYRPKSVDAKATLFTIKNTNITSGRDTNSNDSYAVYLNSATQVRVNYTANKYRGDYSWTSSLADWNTFAVRYGQYTTSDCTLTLMNTFLKDNVPVDGWTTNAGSYFLSGLSQKANSLTIGATVNNGATEVPFYGEIAYFTVTDEMLSKTEFLAYNAALNAKLKMDETLQDVTLNTDTLDIKLGNTVKMQATLIPEKVKDPTITWESSDTTVATVDADGNVLAVGEGTAIITVRTSNPNIIATCTVTVTMPDNVVEATGINLNKTELTLAYVNGAKEQESDTLYATVTPEDATYKVVTWSSEDESVAIVDANTGKVTAIGVGETNIIATDHHETVTASCKVIVTGATTIQNKEIYLNETVNILDLTGDYGTAVTENNSNIANVEVHSAPLAQLGTDSNYNGDYIDVKECLFTFEPVVGAENTYKVYARTADGKTIYLYHGNTELQQGYPTAEYNSNKADNAYHVIVSKHASKDTFALNNKNLDRNSQNSLLCFHNDSGYRFNRQSTADDSKTYFEIYTPVEVGEVSSDLLPGYKQITNLADMSGKQCLIVMKATTGENYYVLRPEAASNSLYDYVGKMEAINGVAKVGTSISITGTGNGKTSATIGSVQYNILVQSFNVALNATRPTDISAGAVVGSLSVSSDAPEGSYTYSLCDGEGSQDNGMFTINESGQLCVGETALTQSKTYKIRVKATNGTDVAETALEVYALGNGLLYESNTEKNISSGNTIDLTTDKNASQMMSMDEATIIVEYTSTATSGDQSLFSISNGTTGNNNRHFHFYITAGDLLGMEIRNNGDGFTDISTNVSGKIKRNYQGKPAKNVVAFKADKEEGVYKLFANGQLVKTVNASDLASGYKFIKDITGIDTVKIGATKRGGSDAYVFTGTVYGVKVYETALSDEELLAETAKVTYPEPESIFVTPEGTGANYYRIPSMITLKSGIVLAAADARFGGTHDSPNNIDIAVVRSEDDGENWSAPEYVFYYDDYADNTLDIPIGNASRVNGSASFIDPVLVQDEETERVFLIADAMSSGIGSPQAVTGSGYTEIDGKRYLKLKKLGETNYDYVVMGENRDIYHYTDGTLTKTEYSLNANFEILLNGELQTVKQMTTTYDSVNGLVSTETDKDVAMNIMYSNATFQALNTTWLYMKYSDNDGETWSDPIFLNEMVKSEEHRAFVVGPGRGTQITTGKYAGRLIVPVYSVIPGESWMAGIIYSDNHGDTWEYAEGADVSAADMTETQVVEMPDGSLRVFARSNNSKIATAVSTDGGETWTAAEYVAGISQPSYGSQLSVIRSSVNIDGKPAIILSTPVGSGRNDGRIKIGLITDTGVEGPEKYDIEWKYDFEVDAPSIGFAYSCLTELGDGKIGILYEKYDSYASGQLQTKHAIRYEEFTLNQLMDGEVVTVIATSDGKGTVSEKTVALVGNEITVTAVPEENYNFVKWTDEQGNLLSEDATYTFTAMEDTIVTAVFEEKPTFVVSVESVVNASENGKIATLTGGGIYHEGNTITVTAPAKVGYEFKGWYVQDAIGTDYVADKELISADYSHSFVAKTTENVNLVAVYTATQKLLLTITDTTDVEVDGEVATEVVYKEAGLVAVTYTGEVENFLYWKNASGKIVSKDVNYRFYLINNTTLTPVIKSETTGSAFVEFVNTYKQILSASIWIVEQLSTYQMSDVVPSELGYEFEGWAFEETPDHLVSETDIIAKIKNAATDHIRLVPVFKEKIEMATVTYYTDGITKTSVEAILGQTHTVTAATMEGKKFSCWKNGTTVVSYNESYTFLVTGDITLTAEFTNDVVEKQSILDITSCYAIENSQGAIEKVAFVASREIAEAYTLLEHGMLYARDSDLTEEMFIEGTDGVGKFTASGTGAKGALTLNVRVGDTKTNIKVRAYAIVEDKNGNVTTIYSSIRTYTMGQQ